MGLFYILFTKIVLNIHIIILLTNILLSRFYNYSTLISELINIAQFNIKILNRLNGMFNK